MEKYFAGLNSFCKQKQERILSNFVCFKCKEQHLRMGKGGGMREMGMGKGTGRGGRGNWRGRREGGGG